MQKFMPIVARQLELSLWQELAAAAQEPEAADLAQLWQHLEQTIREIDRDQQLLLAAEAISQIVEIYVLRAKTILAALEFKDNSKGPVLSEDFLSGLMRQSMSVDLSNLMEDLFPENEIQEPQHVEDAGGSVAVPVDKKTARAIATQARQDAKQMAIELAGQECVSEWVVAIAQWMEQVPDSGEVTLVELQQGLRMSMVEVWLGLLLSRDPQFKVVQHGDFYQTETISIGRRRKEISSKTTFKEKSADKFHNRD